MKYILLGIKFYYVIKIMFLGFYFSHFIRTFFYLSFGRLSHTILLKTIDIYIAKIMLQMNLLKLWKITYGDDKNIYHKFTIFKSELEDKFLNHQIKNYIYQTNNSIFYKIHDNNLNETIVKNVLDEYMQMNALYQNNPDKIQEISKSLSNNLNYLEEMKSHTNPKANKLIIYFYSLIAMACKFGSYWGVGLIRDIQADESALIT